MPSRVPRYNIMMWLGAEIAAAAPSDFDADSDPELDESDSEDMRPAADPNATQISKPPAASPARRRSVPPLELVGGGTVQ